MSVWPGAPPAKHFNCRQAQEQSHRQRQLLLAPIAAKLTHKIGPANMHGKKVSQILAHRQPRLLSLSVNSVPNWFRRPRLQKHPIAFVRLTHAATLALRW